MSFLKNIKPNRPVVGLEGYFVTLLSKSKFGKTTFLYDLIQKYYKGDFSKAILLGAEIGFKTLDGIHAIAITDYNKTSKEEKEQDNFGFIETVDDLIENKKDLSYRMVVIDTITALERLALRYVLSTESRKRGKRLTDITDIAYGGGYTLLAEALYTQIERLKKAGFAVWVIGHEKTQKVTQRDGTEYDLVTLNCQKKTIEIIEREADLIIYGDLIKVIDGDNISESRKLMFRSDGNIICGSRFRKMPNSIELDVDLFIKTFEDAVLASFNGDAKAVEEVGKEQAIEREARSELYISKKSASDLIEELKLIVPALCENDEDVKKQITAFFKDPDNIGMANYTKSEDADGLQRCLDFANSLKKD